MRGNTTLVTAATAVEGQETKQAIQHAKMQASMQETQLATQLAACDPQCARMVLGTLMQHHQHFMQRLRHAAGLQSGVVSDLERQAEAARLQRQQQLAANEQRKEAARMRELQQKAAAAEAARELGRLEAKKITPGARIKL